MIEAGAFTTKKRERRPAFKATSVTKENNDEDSANVPCASCGQMFALLQYPMTPVAVQHYEDSEDELDIGYGTVLLSCMLSLALGFGLGYGT